jgi:hypothetical protein
MRWAGHVAQVGKKRSVYRVLVGKLEGQTPPRRWEHNIKVDLKQYDGKAWTGLMWLKTGISSRLL